MLSSADLKRIVQKKLKLFDACSVPGAVLSGCIMWSLMSWVVHVASLKEAVVHVGRVQRNA